MPRAAPTGEWDGLFDLTGRSWGPNPAQCGCWSSRTHCGQLGLGFLDNLLHATTKREGDRWVGAHTLVLPMACDPHLCALTFCLLLPRPCKPLLAAPCAPAALRTDHTLVQQNSARAQLPSAGPGCCQLLESAPLPLPPWPPASVYCLGACPGAPLGVEGCGRDPVHFAPGVVLTKESSQDAIT